MYKTKILLSLLLVCLIVCVLNSQPTGKINYQGRLEEENELVTGTRVMKFELYDAKEGGNLLWSSGEREVEIKQGIFNYTLGSNVAFPESLFKEKVVYLKITIQGTILWPREEVLIPPYTEETGKVQWEDISGIPEGFGIGGELTENSVGT